MKNFLPRTFSGWILFFCVSGMISWIGYIFMTGESPMISFGISAGEAVSVITVTIVVLIVGFWITADEKG